MACLGVRLRWPELGLDESWEQALVEATDSGRVFGRDLVFTYGPLHQLATSQASRFLLPLLVGRAVYGLAWFSSSPLIGSRRGLLSALIYGALITLLNSRVVGPQGKIDVLVFTLGMTGLLLIVDKPRLSWRSIPLLLPLPLRWGWLHS